jgi:hypothetical protein
MVTVIASDSSGYPKLSVSTGQLHARKHCRKNKPLPPFMHALHPEIVTIIESGLETAE